MVEQKITKREVWIDNLRAFACACVLLVHSPIPFDGVTGGAYLLAPLNHFLMSGGVCVFFMISGALLLAKEQPLLTCYKKRFSRVAFPVLVWSFIYVLIEACKSGTGAIETIKHLCMIPFVSQTGLMWFMYVLCGIYLIAPIMSSWLSKASKNEVELILVFWIFTTLVPYLKVLNPQFGEMIDRTGLLFNFSGFLGYAVLGFYLRRFVTISVKSTGFVVLLAISLCIPIVVFALPFIPNDTLLGSCNIAAVSLSTTIFLFFKQLNGGGNVVIVSIAKYSFGIYLSHMLFMAPFKQMIAPYHLHYAIQIPITALVTGCLAYVFVWMLSKNKFSNYLFG